MKQDMIESTCVLDNPKNTLLCAALLIKNSNLIRENYKVFNTLEYTELRDKITHHLNDLVTDPRPRDRLKLVKGENKIALPVRLFGCSLKSVYCGKAPNVHRKPAPRGKKRNQLRIRKTCGKIQLEDIRSFFGSSDVLRKLPAIVGELNAHLQVYGLNTCLQKAHFFAQITAESGTGLEELAKARSLQKAKELWGDRRGVSSVELEKYTYVSKSANKYIKKNGKILTIEDRRNLLNYVYGKDVTPSLGNKDWGSGYKFRGRGFIHLTGRYNYQKFTDWNKKVFHENIDFTIKPHLITEAKYAARSAAFYWVTRDLHKLAEKGSSYKHVDVITKIINVKMNGADTRRTNFREYWGKL